MVKQQRNAMKNRITIDVGSQGSGVGGVAIFVGGFVGGDAIFVGIFPGLRPFCHRPLF